MINKITVWSIKNRHFIILMMLFVTGVGFYALKNTPVDAIPDLSDVQVIIKTNYPGQAPQVVQDQVTYPISIAMLSVPGATTVRGFSFFGDSYVYVIFDEGTDMYWARSRVQEYLSQAQSSLPKDVLPQLGPDATGVGWVYMYALTDQTGTYDLAQLRSMQDWLLKFELQTVKGVAEIATIGGMVKQYQIKINPEKLKAHRVPLAHVSMAIQRANQEFGASVIEMAEAEYMIKATGYLKNITDIENVPLGVDLHGQPLLIKDIAEVVIGPQMRRGISDLNGDGEAVGGIVVMRYGENAQEVIKSVKIKLQQLQNSLPNGIEIKTVYDRSTLINNAIDYLWHKLFEEFLIVALICMVFLFHVSSSIVAIISLPVGILSAYIVMYMQGITANIMSLGGIAIAIGAMIDGAIVLIENMHKHIEKRPLTKSNRWDVVAKSVQEVGPALFFSLLIITVSFLPVFTLEAQEGRMFSPLAYTKTYAMAVSAGLTITLVPVLMGYLIRGNVVSETKNPINRLLLAVYLPTLKTVLRYPRLTIILAFLLLLTVIYPIKKIGSEFMPSLDEGDLMYMPTTYPGVSVGKARQILQQTDRLIKTVPEVLTVFGKVGRAETATDPAPMSMIETIIQFKPKDQWRPGLTKAKLKEELQALISVPGLTNAWVEPIKTRIDMLATGIKTPIGIKIAGPELKVIEKIGQEIENILADVEGTESIYSERVAGGRYVIIDIDRQQAAKFGLNIKDIQQIIGHSIAGVNVTQTVEGLERYPVNLRYPQNYREDLDQLKMLPILTNNNLVITLGDVANIYIDEGPSGIKSENARLNGWSLIDISSSDVGSYIDRANQRLKKELKLPVGYTIKWAGQYEYMQRAAKKLSYIVPLTLMLIILLLYGYFKNASEVLMILGTLPFSLVGGFWLVYLFGYNMSVAVAVGFIALAGVAVEIGVLMLTFLNHAHKKSKNLLKEEFSDKQQNLLYYSILQGAGLRVRPIVMTAFSISLGLLPVAFGTGTGSEIMSRIALPMIGGMVTTVILGLLVIPVIYYLWNKKRR